MRIGELLIMNGIIMEKQLEQALQLQQIQSNKKIGELLINSGDITERQLVEVLEFQLGIPVINMAEAKFEESIIHQIQEATAREYNLIPVEQKNGVIKLAMVDPLNHEAIKQCEKETGMTVQPHIATRTEVEQAITKYYGTKQLIEDINRIIQAAVEKKAKYIHFTPEEDELVIKFQIGDKVILQKAIPKDAQQTMIDRIKIMSGLNVTNRSLPQEGKLHIQKDHQQIDLNISILPTINGENIQARILNYSEASLTISELGLTTENFHIIDRLVQQKSGMLFIAGPPNSGQSSTLYALLNHLHTGESNVISLEDPVEHRIKGVTQVEVNTRIGLKLSEAIPFALKRNPDIIMIDDVNSRACLELTAQAAWPGRLLICGSQAYSAVHAIRRMIGLGIDKQMLSSAIIGVIAQRLVPRVCKHCAQTMTATDEEIKNFENHNLVNIDAEKNGSKSMIGNFRTYVSAQLSGKMTVVRGSGCQVCNHSGYYGSIGIHEVLQIDQKLKQLILQSLPDPDLELYLKEQAYKTMLYDGLLKAREGLTTVEEVLKVVH